jgi:hypothetical protein
MLTSGMMLAFLTLPPLALLIGISLVALVTAIPDVRHLVALYVRVNYFFASAVIRFYFRNERSIQWAKLETTNLKSNSAA